MSFQEINDLKKQLQKTIQEKGEATLREEFKKVFDILPEIHCISWQQYTPYFMDGDPCEFGVGEPQIFLSKESAEEDGEERDYEGDITDYQLRAYAENRVTEHSKSDVVAKWNAVQINTVRELLDSIQSNEELMEFVFGDHVTVKATRDGFETEEYEHD